MANNIRDTKKIARNTLVLYVCMALTMVVTLYASRLVLQALGVDDFGLYNVVCGVAALLSFMKTSLTTSTQRFLSFEMGKGETDELKRVFSMSVTTHIIICAFIVLLSETIGLWFLNTHVLISPDRLVAANWIYQFSVLSLCFSTLSVPYSADVISHESMTFYAVTNVVAAIAKLILTISLLYVTIDRLTVYGAMMALVELMVLGMFWIYCKRKYIETHYRFFFDKSLFSKIFSFSGWTILGQISVVGANSGTSILVNIYYNVAANAAMGIAQQVNNAITGLTANFQTAFQPQITKSYAANDVEYLNAIICKASKISYFLLFIVSIPIMMNIDLILRLWLGTVPEYAGTFSILFLVASWMNAVSAPLWIASYATGRIKAYQIAVSVVFFSDIIIVWALFHYFDVPPTASMMAKVAINMLVVLVRLAFTKHLVSCFSAMIYARNVLMRCTAATLLTLIPLYVCMKAASGDTLMIFALSVAVFLWTSLVVYLVGFDGAERAYLRGLSQKVINKIKNR